jgi:hypothetical protein
MRVINTKYLSVIFLILISAASCAPKLVTPEIDYNHYAELKQVQPNCGGELSALTSAEVKSDKLILDTLFCYRSIWKYWENEYLILDTQLESVYQSN